MKNIGAAVSFLFLCSVAASAQALIIPQVVDGGVWQTTIVVTNTSATAATARLSFFIDTAGNATQPWNPPFLEVGSTQSISLPGGATIFLHTPGTAAALAQGWGQLTGSAGVVAYAVFTERLPGFPAQEGTAPAIASASRILVPFDDTAGTVAAMGLVNATADPETISVSFRTTGGTVTQSTIANLPAHGHIAFTFPQQFPATAGQSGLAEFYVNSGSFAILALSFNPAGSLTTAPVYVQSGPPIIHTGSGTAPSISGFSWDTTPQNRVNFSGNISGSAFTPAATVYFCVAGTSMCYQQPPIGVSVQTVTNIRVMNVNLTTGNWVVQVRTAYGTATSSSSFAVQ